MKKNTKLIYYVSGCYGTFIEWLCTTFYTNSDIKKPFTETGSSHNFLGNFLHPHIRLHDYLNSESDFDFARVHPEILKDSRRQFDPTRNKEENLLIETELLKQDIEFLLEKIDKVLILYPTATTRIWILNNSLTKFAMDDQIYKDWYEPIGISKESLEEEFVQGFDNRVKYIVNKYYSPLFKFWGKNSIVELEDWEIREILAGNYFTNEFGHWEQAKLHFSNNSKIKFISMDRLKTNSYEAIRECFEFFNITGYSPDKVIQIIKEWEQLQIHKNKDSDISSIVNSIINHESLSWDDKEFSLLEEAFIEKSLRDADIKIKCHKLNKFPTNTKEFENFLIRP